MLGSQGAHGDHERRMTIVAINLIALAILILFIGRLARSGDSLLQLGVPFALHLMMNYPIRVLLLYYFPVESRPGYTGLTTDESLMRVSLTQLGGLLAFSAAYLWTRPKAARRSVLDQQDIEVRQGDIAALLVAFFAYSSAVAYKIASGDYISFLLAKDRNLALANLVEILMGAGWVAFAGVWLLWFAGQARSPFRRLLFASVNLGVLSYQIIQGSKTYLLLPFAIVLATYYQQRRRIPWIGLGVFGCFGVMVVFPYVAEYRGAVDGRWGGIPKFGQFEAEVAISEAYRGTGNLGSTASSKVFGMLARFGGADELYNLMNSVPSRMPYKYGEDFVAIPLGLVPRALWPSKPVIATGADYGSALGTVASVTPFPIGEMYWNFGELGVVLGMAMWGCILAAVMRALDWTWKYRRLRYFVLCCFIERLYWMSTGEGTLAMLLASLPKRVIVYGGLYLLGQGVTGMGPGPVSRRTGWRERGTRSEM